MLISPSPWRWPLLRRKSNVFSFIFSRSAVRFCLRFSTSDFISFCLSWLKIVANKLGRLSELKPKARSCVSAVSVLPSATVAPCALFTFAPLTETEELSFSSSGAFSFSP
ncbi:Uncharacterised protein [Vibrio cholerae]|nr:Uncharacterised protein [Vibrio cholerae]